ncbi:phage portal protein [Thioclava sp. GXIMD4215]|uniref:phage portal protein n=1 Tax=Thioclava sp. GXIMD4215 TaxID=3131928 RepID=UPI00324D620A
MAFPFRRRKADPPRTSVRMLEGASDKRWSKTPAFGATGSEVLAGAAQVRGRGRHLRFNDPTAANATEILRTALVGYGATVTCGDEARDADFAEWSSAARFFALQGEVIDALVTDGESLIIMRTDDNGALRLQHVPAEQLDEAYSVDLDNGWYIAAGIEYDADDQSVAYHFRPSRPTDQYQTFRQPVRVEAADVIHLFRRQGAGQTRGLSWFAPVILPLNELSQLQDALQVTAKVQAMMTGFLIDQNGTATSAFGDGENPMDLSLEPGTLRVLPAGWDIRFSTPQQMAQSVELVAVSLRQIAAGLQIPEFLLSGDMRGVNYSSARTALVQFRSRIEAIQHSLLVPVFYEPIWRRWLALEALRGADGVDPQTKVEIHFPKPQWVDPESDAKATREMLDMGLISRRQAVAQLGYDVAVVDAEIAADREREATLGLTFSTKRKEQKESKE